MLSVAAARYAKALVDVVTESASKSDTAVVLGQLREIQQLIASSAELRGALASPAVAPSRKRAVMRVDGGQRTNYTMLNYGQLTQPLLNRR